MIIWVVAGLLALATGFRIGWALVNRQSVVNAGMIVALTGLTLFAALNWSPLSALVDSALGRPNVSAALSLVALVASATGSAVMITSVASTRGPASTRRWAVLQYLVGALLAAVVVGWFVSAERRPPMNPRAYLESALGGTPGALLPLLYVLLALSLVTGVGLRLASPSRRGRALFVFSLGSALIVAAGAVFVVRAVGYPAGVGGGSVAMLLTVAMVTVAVGVLLPTVEDWLAARREMTQVEPLLHELRRRHPDVGIGERPRGPLVFQVAEQLSQISDALYLEAAVAEREDGRPSGLPAEVTPTGQAAAIARWIHAGPRKTVTAFPGDGWLHQPQSYSDREWILEIARQYRALNSRPDRYGVATPPGAGATG